MDAAICSHVVIYELLSGRRLFEGANAAQVLEALLQKEAPPLPPISTIRVCRQSSGS
jgi:hypothetical protein